MRYGLYLSLITTIMCSIKAPSAIADAGEFSGYEIRVIRPKFMTKRGRLELGGQGIMIMNQSFIYTFLASGILDYHLSEMFAIELAGAFGESVEKEDKKILESDFKIQTSILRTQYMFNGGLIWTPIYGKTQLPSGELVYFDSFLSFQAGMTGIRYTYEQCITPPAGVDAAASAPPKPSPKTYSYPTFSLGFGQKYFLDESTALRWDVRDYFLSYQQAHGNCDPTVPAPSGIHQNVTIQFGMSTFL